MRKFDIKILNDDSSKALVWFVFWSLVLVTNGPGDVDLLDQIILFIGRQQ